MDWNLDLKTPAARGFLSLSVNRQKRKTQYFQRLEDIYGNRRSMIGVSNQEIPCPCRRNRPRVSPALLFVVSIAKMA
jgi:hypothetical protein